MESERYFTNIDHQEWLEEKQRLYDELKLADIDYYSAEKRFFEIESGVDRVLKILLESALEEIKCLNYLLSGCPNNCGITQITIDKRIGRIVSLKKQIQFILWHFKGMHSKMREHLSFFFRRSEFRKIPNFIFMDFQFFPEEIKGCTHSIMNDNIDQDKTEKRKRDKTMKNAFDYQEWLEEQKIIYDDLKTEIKSYGNILPGFSWRNRPGWSGKIEMDRAVTEVLEDLLEASLEEIKSLNSLILGRLPCCKNTQRSIDKSTRLIGSLKKQIEFILTNFDHMHSRRESYLSDLYLKSSRQKSPSISFKDFKHFPREISDFSRNIMFGNIYHDNAMSGNVQSKEKRLRLCKFCGEEQLVEGEDK